MRVIQVLGALILVSACDSATEPGVPTHIKAVLATSLTGADGLSVEFVPHQSLEPGDDLLPGDQISAAG